MPEILYSRELLKLMAKRPALKARIESVVRDHFPEIAQARFGRASRSAYYDVRSGTVRVNSGCSVYVIGHKLVHYLQDARHSGDGAYPSGGAVLRPVRPAPGRRRLGWRGELPAARYKGPQAVGCVTEKGRAVAGARSLRRGRAAALCREA
jgi:hypothetical protein